MMHERDEISIAGDDDHYIKLRRHLYRVHRKAHIPVGLFGAAGEYLEVLGLRFNSNLCERFKERLLVARLRRYHIRDSANERAPCYDVFQHSAEIYPCVI